MTVLIRSCVYHSRPHLDDGRAYDGIAMRAPLLTAALATAHSIVKMLMKISMPERPRGELRAASTSSAPVFQLLGHHQEPTHHATGQVDHSDTAEHKQNSGELHTEATLPCAAARARAYLCANAPAAVTTAGSLPVRWAPLSLFAFAFVLACPAAFSVT